MRPIYDFSLRAIGRRPHLLRKIGKVRAARICFAKLEKGAGPYISRKAAALPRIPVSRERSDFCGGSKPSALQSFFHEVFAAAVFRCSEATALLLLSARKRAGACPRASSRKATVLHRIFSRKATVLHRIFSRKTTVLHRTLSRKATVLLGKQASEGKEGGADPFDPPRHCSWRLCAVSFVWTFPFVCAGMTCRRESRGARDDAYRKQVGRTGNEGEQNRHLLRRLIRFLSEAVP